MEQENETTNIKPKEINSNFSNHPTFFPQNQDVQLQLYTNPNRQCNHGIQHQQKIENTKPLYDNKENMVFDKQKPNVF
jgi:hypothetical protein